MERHGRLGFQQLALVDPYRSHPAVHLISFALLVSFEFFFFNSFDDVYLCVCVDQVGLHGRWA